MKRDTRTGSVMVTEVRTSYPAGAEPWRAYRRTKTLTVKRTSTLTVTQPKPAQFSYLTSWPEPEAPERDVFGFELSPWCCSGWWAAGLRSRWTGSSARPASSRWFWSVRDSGRKWTPETSARPSVPKPTSSSTHLRASGGEENRERDGQKKQRCAVDRRRSGAAEERIARPVSVWSPQSDPSV